MHYWLRLCNISSKLSIQYHNFCLQIIIADKQFSHFKRYGEHSDSQQHKLGSGSGIREQEEGGISAQVSKSQLI